MKRIALFFAMSCFSAFAALEGQPVYKMTEAQLLGVAKSGELDDRMTACQELAPVQNADNIVVLEKGSVIEQGSHQELVSSHGAYYNLVKNQLNLGN